MKFLELFLPGTSESVKRLREEITRLNEPTSIALIRTVLIVGESGAGKTHVARVISAHREYLQAKGDTFESNLNLDSYLQHFDEINVPNLPDQLVESELFGHTRNAFTGAQKEKYGLLSGEGTIQKTDILLDEIGDASLALQAKLLQVVETGRFRRLGASPGDDEETQARLFFATNHDLALSVKEKKFRQDFFWRINTIQITVPPIRDQKEQIVPLLTSILGQFNKEIRRVQPLSNHSDLQFSLNDTQWAESFDWPGNVRQLRSAIQRWLFYGGRRSLRDAAISIEGSAAHAQPPKTLSYVIDRLEGNDELRSLGDLLLRSERKARREIIEWYDRTSPSSAYLEKRFPAMKAKSIRQKISDWRREFDENG